jgi:indolepyruvate ferredoxin oxidoreductase
VLVPIMDQSAKRIPFFCSGCPHNTSTNVPEGSLAMSGIGCHGMALWAKPGTTLMGTQMGGEGVTWASLQHFTTMNHMFQNLGDGTYYHSGLLAVRQSVAAKSNITYKILFNDAVAMTGGQPFDGPLSPSMIAAQVLAEGVERVVLVSEDPSRHPSGSLPAGVPVLPRTELDRVQRELRDVPGCTVIIYDQTCAAEKRRRRKRKLMDDPMQRVVINDAVCEGCGDCSVQSGCVSIEPLETALGRKRRINQSSCNKDYSCTKGFCPSFVTVKGVQMKKRSAATIDARLFDSLPEPAVLAMPAMGVGIMIAGIGGTGVITVSAVLAMAAHLQSCQASVYDMTGMSQKNGAVLSHLRIAGGVKPIPTQSIGLGEAQLVLAFDLVAAVTEDSFRTMAQGTRLLGNSRVQSTAALNFNPDEKIDTSLLMRKIQSRIGDDHAAWIDATGLALALCGDAIASNFFMVGVALQKGWLPLALTSVERAIELNGVQVPFNLQALRLGRLWAHDRAAVEKLMVQNNFVPELPPVLTLDELLADRARRLADYQDQAYADRFTQALAAIRAAEQKAVPGATQLSETAVRALYRVMAYKDEYEVARLQADPAFIAGLKAQFDGDMKLRFHLAPPLFSRRDARTGELLKREFGGWMLPVFKGLAKLKFLRGTAFDLFGYTAERRSERALAEHYEALLGQIAAGLNAHNHAAAVELAGAVMGIRGYGHVKHASHARVMKEEPALVAKFHAASLPGQGLAKAA